MHETNFSLAATSTSTTGGQEFYSALQAQTMKAVGSIFNGTITPIQYPQQGQPGGHRVNWRYPMA